jgi:hypothetical protein
MQNEAKPWSKDPIKQSAAPAYIRSLGDLREFRTKSPQTLKLADGTIVRQLTDQEFLAKAEQDNASDIKMHRQSGMSGWITEEGGQHILIKLDADSPYDLTVPDESTATSLSSDISNMKSDPEELEYDGEFSDRDFDLYADVVGQIESNGDYTVVGGYNNHYQGKYQFGRLALKDVGIGFSKEARQAFLQDPELQETAFQSLTMQNHKTLMRLSAKYRRLSQREQLAILAMAHNAGAGGALDYLRTGQDTADGFGTKGTKYINAVRSAFQGGEA